MVEMHIWAYRRRVRWSGGAQRMLLLAALLVSCVGSTGSARLELSAATVRADTSFDITITAPEWDTDPSLVGALRAVVTCDKVNEPAHVANLIETDVASGIFVGRMSTVLSTAAALPLPGLINVVPGTQIKVTYPNSALAATIRVLFPGVIALPPSIAIGDDLQLHLKDPDMNRDSTAKDAVDVTLTVSCTIPLTPERECPEEVQMRPAQSVESLRLTETAPDSGIFTAAVKTYLQEGALAPHALAGDQAIDLRGASSRCSADEVTVAYNDAAPAANRSAVSRASFKAHILSSHSYITASVNQTINITVVDGDLLNTSMVNVTVTASKVDEPPETIMLRSIGTCQGMPTFVGEFHIHKAWGEPIDGDQKLQVRPGDILTISYLDASPEVSIQKRVRVLTNGTIVAEPSLPGKSLLLVDTSIATVELGGDLTVTISDEDQDLEPYEVDSISGLRVALADNSSRSFLTLLETGLSTGIFTAAHPVKAAADCVSDECKSSSLIASQGDNIVVEYSDTSAEGSVLLRQASARVASTGILSISTGTAVAAPGDVLSITVVDADLNQLSTSVETVSVFVTADKTADSNTLTLVEMAASSAIFTGMLTTSITADPCKLLVLASTASRGSVIEVAYLDVLPVSSTMARLRMCSSAELTISPQYFVPGAGSALSVTLVDADLQGNELVIERVTVSVVATQETDTMELVETGWATSTFTGMLRTTSATTSNSLANDGLITLRQCCTVRDTVFVEYTEGCPSQGVASNTSHAALPGTLQATPLLVKPGDTITVTVTDEFLNTAPDSAQTYAGLVSVSESNQTIPLSLTENGDDTGVFIGTLDTSAVAAAGKLLLPTISGVENSPITVRFTDVIENEQPKAVVLETQRKGSITMVQQGVDAGRISIGESLLIAAYDKDLDYSGGSVNVQLSKTGTADTVNVSLTADGMGQGRYTGLVPTSTGAGPGDDATLNSLLTGETVTAVYTDTDGTTSTAQFVAGQAGTLQVENDDGGLINVLTAYVDVVVIDSDLNTNVAVRETYTYYGQTGVVNLQRETLSYVLALQEQSVNSTRFICRINFDQAVNANLPTCIGIINSTCAIQRLTPTGPNDNGLRWDRISLEYTDPEIVTGAAVKSVEGNCVMLWIAPGQDANLQPPIPPTLVAGAILNLQVMDQDMSKDVFNPETLTVTVTKNDVLRANDNNKNDVLRANEMVQSVTLTETGIQSAYFTGQLRTYNDLAINTNVAGGMNVAEGEVLTVSYNDVSRRQVSTALLINKEVKVVGWNMCRGGMLDGQMCSGVGDMISCGTGYCGSSKPVLSVGTFKVGSCVEVTMRDPDSNTDDISKQTLVVEVENLLRNDKESITLAEVSLDSQNFVGCLESMAVGADGIGTAGDGKLAVFAGDQVSIRFDDKVPVVSISRTLVAIPSHLAQLSVSPNKLNIGDDLHITVTDDDVNTGANTGASKIDVALVTVAARGASFATNLTETGTNTGVFTGLVSTSRGQPSILGGLVAGDTVTVSYFDELPAREIRSIDAVVGHVAVLTIPEIRLEGTSTITLTDIDAPDSEQLLASLSVLTHAGGQVVDTKLVFLSRTAVHTVFTGQYTITSANSAANGESMAHPILLGADLTTSIQVVYQDSSPQINISKSISVVSSSSGELYIPNNILSGTPLLITVVDQDLNLDSSTIEESMTVVSSSNALQLDESVVVRETSPSSGTFTALLATYQGGSHARMNDGAMDSNPGDTLTVTYQEAAPSRALLGVVRVATSAQAVLSLSSYNLRVGEALSITVEDSDLNMAADVTDFSQVVVSVGGASQQIDLKETDLASALFTGMLHTVGGSGSGSLSIDTNHEITVTYLDAAPTSELISKAQVIASKVATIDIGPLAGEFLYDTRVGTKMRTIVAGDPVAVTVVDSDLNINAIAIEESIVTFYTSRNDQLSKVLLYETGLNSDTFTGTLSTRLVESALGGSVDIMDIGFGDRISAYYDDHAPAAVIESDAVLRIASVATIHLTPKSGIAGTQFNIVLSDQDLDRNATLKEKATVNIVSSRIIGSTYSVELTETADSSGVFTASIQSQERTTTALAQHGIINVENGDTISVEYNDVSPVGRVASSSARVEAQSCGCANITTDFVNLAAGESVTVTVYDRDVNKQRIVADTLVVVVTNLGRPDQIYTQMELTETAPDTSYFTGVLQTRDNKIQPDTFVGNSFEINVDAGNDIAITYTHITPTGTEDKGSLVYVQFVATMKLSPIPLLPGAMAAITVRDDDMDVGDTIDEALARVTSSRPSEPDKEITLIETAARSGVFTGVFTAREDSAIGILSDVGRVNVDPGDILTVSYQESLPRIRTVEEKLPISDVAIVNIGPRPMRANGIITVEVADVDANLDPIRPEMVTVNVSTSAEGILRTVALLESGISTGIFTGVMVMSSDASESNVKLAPVRAKEMLTVSYYDKSPAGLTSQELEVLESVPSHLSSASLLKAGGRLAVSVTDPDLNDKVPESIVVTAEVYRPVLTPGVPPGTYSNQGSCFVTLRKQMPYSTTFHGILETGSSQSVPNCLYVEAADKVRLNYAEPSPVANISVEVSIMSSYAGSITTSASKLVTNGAMHITVTDSDLDTHGDEVETVTIDVQSSVSALSAVKLQLTETSTSSSHFTGTIQIEPWTACTLDDWGCTQYSTKSHTGENTNELTRILYVEPGHTVALKYLDVAPYVLQQVVIPVCTTGKLEVHPLVIAIGWNVSIWVVDPDRAGSSTTQVTATVDGGRYLTIPLNESAPGQFTGSAETSFLNEDKNGTIQMSGDGSVHFVFFDDCPGISVAAQVKAYKLGTIHLTPNPIQIGEETRIVVVDQQNAISSDSPTIQAICSGSLGDEQSITLTQTGVGVGTYTGSFVPGLAGQVTGLPDTSVSCRYPLQTPPSLLVQAAPIQRSFTGVVTATPDIVNTGGVLTISVNDKDLNIDPTTVETHSMRMHVETPQDSRMLDLTEMSLDNSVFTGMLIVAEQVRTGAALDTIVGLDKQFVSATYSDNAPKGTIHVQNRVSASNVGDLRIKPDYIRVSSEVQVLISDPDLNRDPNVIESSIVTVSVLSPGSSRGIIDVQGRRHEMNAVVHMTEMTPNTQFFTGKLITMGVPDATFKPSTPQFDNVIYVMVNYMVTLEYADAAPLAVNRLVKTVLSSQVGQLSFTPNPPTISQALSVTVIDSDLEYDPARDILPGLSYSAGPSNCDEFGNNPGCRDVGVLPIVPTSAGGSVYTGALYLFEGIAIGPAGPCYLTCFDVSTKEGETIVLNYSDSAPNVVSTVQVKVATSARLNVRRIGSEGVVDITVYDQDLNQKMSLAETGQAIVQRHSSFAISQMTVQLKETGGDTGFFTGLLPTTATTEAPAGTMPQVVAGQNITVRYYDASPNRLWKTKSSLVVPSTMGKMTFTSTGEQMGNIFKKPARLTYYLEDDDLNLDPVREDTINIIITSSDSRQGSEAVTLLEMGFNTGIFTADLMFTAGSFNGIPNNLAMDVNEGDFITAVYQDMYPYKAIVSVAKAASIGRLFVNPDPVTAGRDIYITVIDADLNTDKDTVDTGSVMIFNKERYDNETVVLTEMSWDSSIFTGVTASSSVKGRRPNVLSGLYEGGAVHAVYADKIPDFVVNNCQQCLVTSRVAMTANVSVFPTLLSVAGSMTVTVTDTDLNLDTTTPEKGEVEVKQFFRAPYDVRKVVVTETGPNTDKFTGVLATSPTYIPGRYGTYSEGLYGPQGGRISVNYFDKDPFPSRFRNATTRLSMIGSISVGPSPVNPDNRVTITVHDDDLDVTIGVDEQVLGSVFVSSPNDIWNNQGISVLLRETGPSTGYFTGSILSREEQSTSASVIVSGAIQGSYITATYSDPIPFGTHTAVTRVATFANLTMSPRVLYEGQSITVTVTDDDLNDDPTKVEEHNVSVSQVSADPDSMNLTVVETSNSSKYFTGTMQTSLTGGSGILKSPEGSLVMVAYLDKNPTPSRTLTASRRVSIQGTLLANTATVAEQAASTDGTPRFKPTSLATDNTAMTSCFINPDASDCSATCLCRSFSDIFVTVIDEDLDGPTPPTVIAYNKKGIEYEHITMVSKGVTATFSGKISVTDNPLEGDSDSSKLNVVPGDIVQLAYIDNAPPKNVIINYRIPYVGRAEFLPKTTSSWKSSESIIVGVDSLKMRLTDMDLTGHNTATVTITGNVGPDTETVTLRVSDTPGVFTGTIATENNYRGVHAQDGTMQVHREDTIKITYQDAIPTSTQGMQLGVNYFDFKAQLLTHQRVLLPYGNVYITLVDCDLPQLNEYATEAFVEVLTAAGDSVTVKLTETSDVCGEYTGMVETLTRQKFDTTRIDAATPGSKVTVKYLDCHDNTPVKLDYNMAKQASLSFASAVESRAAGLPITVLVNDTDQDSSPEADTARVTIKKEGRMLDYEVLNLTETGGRTGIFTAVLNTSFDDTSKMFNHSNGILHACRMGDTVSATYFHSTLLESVTASMTFTSEAGTVIVNNSSRPFSPNETLTITITDMDLNADIYEAETYQSVLSVTSGVDSEWVLIRETARNSRAFTGIIHTSSLPGSDYDATLNTVFNASGGSIAAFYYNDTVFHGNYPKLCRTDGFDHGCHIQYRRAHSVGELTLSQSVHAEVGKPIGVTVMDGDLNTDFTVADTAMVVITKASGGASMHMPLTESGRNTGIFTGTIAISDTGTWSVSQLAVTQFDALTFAYTDANPTRSPSVVIQPRYLGRLSDTFNVLLAGGAVRISLTDKDLNTDDAVAERVSGIYVTNIMTHQREQVTLIETGVNSGTAGTFTGVMSTLADKSRGIDFSGHMNVQPGDLLNIVYSDTGPLVGITRDVRVATKGEVTKSPLLVAVDLPMTVTVSDLDMDRDVLAVDTIPSLLKITKDSLSKTLPLTETGLTTGIFTAAMTLTEGVMSSTTFGPVLPWESITVTYTDQMPLDTIEKILPVFDQGKVTLSPWPWIHVAQEFLTITINDMDMNRDDLISETITPESDQAFVTLYSNADQNVIFDREYIELTETRPDSGIFTSVLDVDTGGNYVHDDGVLGRIEMRGSMGVSRGDVIEASYFDMAPSKRVRKYVFPSNVGVLSLSPCLPGESPCKAVVGAGVLFTVTVTDRDLNLDPLVQEQVTVTVRTDRLREPVETITLTECSVNNGLCEPHIDSDLFVGNIQTVRSASYSDQGDRVLNVMAGNCDKSCTGCATASCDGFLIAQYNDVSPGASIKKYAKVGHIGKIDMCKQINNQEPLDHCLFDFSSSVVTVTVTDPDLNLHTGAVDIYAGAINVPTGMRVSVHAQYSRSTDRALVTSSSLNVAVRETGANTNVFTGAFSAFAGSADQQGSLQVFDDNTQDVLRSASAVITATYMDATSEYPKAFARFRTDSSIKMSARTCNAPCDLPIGNPLTITVIDGDMDQNRLIAETVSVQIKPTSISAAFLKDEQRLTLTETGPSTGTFVASVATSIAKEGIATAVLTCDDTVIHVYEEPDVRFTATYSELAPLGQKNLQADAGLTAKWPGTITITPNVSYVGSEITVTVQDFDLTGLGSAPMAQITSDYVATPNHPSRTIQLQVTNRADKFTGTYQLDAAFLGTPAGTQRRSLTASYIDASHANTVRSYEIQLASVGVLSATPFADTISSLQITLQDSSLDKKDEVETLTPGVSVSTNVGGVDGASTYTDIETVVLTETGPSTSTFTGSLPMVRATAKIVGDGILQGDLGRISQATALTTPVIQVTYQDTLPPQAVTLSKNIECEGKVIVPRTFEPEIPFTVTVSDCDLAASNAPNTPSYVATIAITIRTAHGIVTRNITVAPQLPFVKSEYKAEYIGNVTTNSTYRGTQEINGVVSRQDLGSTVHVIYPDAAPHGQRQASTVANILGEINITATYNSKASFNSKYKIDKKSFVSITDRDANADPLVRESVTIYAKTDTDEERLTLMECGENSNTFTGWLPADTVAAHVRGDKLISPVASHIPITVRYEDSAPFRNITVVVVGSDFDSVQLKSPVNPFNGDPVVATVVDSDLNTDNTSPQLHVNLLHLSRCSPKRNINCVNSSDTVDNGQFCENQQMLLTESAQASATFTGELSALTCLNDRTNRDSKFYVVCEGLETCDVTAAYTDETWGLFTSVAKASRMGLLATSHLTSAAGANTLVAGEALYITVTDADLNTIGSLVESATVSVNNSLSSIEIVHLTETGVDTSIFTAVVMTIQKDLKAKHYVGIETPEASDPLAVLTKYKDVSSVNKVQVNAGQNLEIAYHDASPSGHVVTRTIAPQTRASIESTPFPLLKRNPTTGQAVGISEVTVTVVDQDSSSSLSIDTVSVNVTVYTNETAITRDHEVMVLNETGVATGKFTGRMSADSVMSRLSNTLLTNLHTEKYKYTIRYFQVGTGGSPNGTTSPTVYRKEAVSAMLEAPGDLRAGAAIYVTVTDDDQDLDWEVVDNVVLEVTSNKLHEGSETLTLSETGLSTGLFTGMLITAPSDVAGGQNDAIMNVVQGNSLRVAYVEPHNYLGQTVLLTKTINVTSAGSVGKVILADKDQNYTESMLINEEDNYLSILVIDGDAKSTIFGTQVTVTTPLQSLSYSLNENTTLDLGNDRYAMTVPITKVFGTRYILGGFAMGNLITVSYQDLLPYRTITTQGVVNRAAVLQALPQPIGMGDTLTITVIDADLNEDEQVPNVGTVFVQSSRVTEGTESVPITETGASTNIFTGLLRTALRTLAGAANTGNMNVEMSNVLTLSYIEKARYSIVTDASKLKTITIQVGMPGTLQASEVVRPSGYIIITVTDPDLNLTPENMEYANVKVSTSKDYETEVVKLTQTGPTTGIFTGILLTCTRCTGAQCPDLCITPPCTCVDPPTCLNVNGEPLPMNCPSEVQGPSNDGVLYVEQGNLLATKYFERMPEMTHQAVSHIARIGSLATVPATYLIPGADINVVVLDNDANKDPTKVETLNVIVKTEKFEESSEQVELHEDDLNSGRFVGALRTIASSPTSPITTILNDGVMAVDPGDILRVEYQDEQTFSGFVTTITSQLTAASAGTMIACAVNGTDECLHFSYEDEGVTVWMALPGESFAVNVTDIDLALDTDTANVSAYVFPTGPDGGTGDYEPLNLKLVGDSVFEGSVRSEVGTEATPMNGILTLSADSEITFTYTDEVPRVTKKAIVRMAAAGVLEVGPRLLNGYPALAVNLTDRDLNKQAATREVVTVDVINQRFPDFIARVGLLESAPSSGFFQGSITLTYASTAESVNDGTLRGLSGDPIDILYEDALPTALIKSTTPNRFAGGLQVSGYNVGGNEVFAVTLTDGDLDADKMQADRINASVSLQSDVEGPIVISMTETGLENGIFTASILPRLTDTGIDIDAIDPFGLAYQVQVDKGQQVRLTYVDAHNGIPVTESVNIFTKAQIDVSVAFRGSDGVLQVTMMDADQMGSRAVLTAQIYTSDSAQAVETVQLNGTGAFSATFTGNILTQAHTGVTIPGRISLRDTDSIFVRYFDMEPVATIIKEVSAPKPRFMEPTPPANAKFSTAVDCAFQLGLRGADASLEFRRLVGGAVVIAPTRYRDKDGTFKQGVAPGVSLSPTEAGMFFETSMSWTPRREQEGGVFLMCFAVEESHGLVSGGGESSERCFEITVTRCRKCALPGENLNQIAMALGSEWLTVWSFNPRIKTPQDVLDGQLINTSLVYRVVEKDSMASISMRFGTTVKFLLAINADLTAKGDLAVNETVCVLPNQLQLDGCSAQARSTTWEKLEEQYVPVDYYDNPFNWEDIQWTDLGGKPVKTQNPDYPQLPARQVGKEPGYSLPPNVVV